ncbi:hypothetical protein EH331_12875 [Enterococcus faecalis]|nr:hypothetical protein [Enterococcus faecalis]
MKEGVIVAMSDMDITAFYKELAENQEIVCIDPKEEKSMNKEMIEENALYQEFLGTLVLNNRVLYSEIPYPLRIKHLGYFHHAIRVVRDYLADAEQFVCIMETFLQDIALAEEQDGQINTWLRRKAYDAILGVEDLFTGEKALDVFIQQQKKVRPWLFE